MRTLRVLALLITLTVAAASADDLTDELRLAVEKYESGDIQGALESVRLAEAWLLEQQAEGLSSVFGELEGWELEVGDASGQTAGMTFAGGGVAASARYTREDDEWIDASVVGNSPYLAMVTSMISNPMIASSQGGKIIKIGKRKAMVKQDGAEWELTVPDASTLVTIKTNTTRENAVAAAEAILWEQLSTVLSAQ